MIPRCSPFTILLTRLTTIGKNYNLSFFLGLHDFLDDSFGTGFLPWESLNGANHFSVGFALVA